MKRRRWGSCCLGSTMRERRRSWRVWQAKTSQQSHRLRLAPSWFSITTPTSTYNTINLQLGLQHQVRPDVWLPAECLGHRRPEKDQTVLEELLWQHRRSHLCHRLLWYKAIWRDRAGAPSISKEQRYPSMKLHFLRMFSSLEFQELLTEEKLSGAPILVFANKQVTIMGRILILSWPDWSWSW